MAKNTCVGFTSKIWKDAHMHEQTTYTFSYTYIIPMYTHNIHIYISDIWWILHNVFEYEYKNREHIRIRMLFESIHEYIHEYLEYFKTQIVCSVLFANMTYLYATQYILSAMGEMAERGETKFEEDFHQNTQIIDTQSTMKRWYVCPIMFGY